MITRPTPETDAAIADGHTFNHEDLRTVIAFCQRLERERDEARQKLDESQAYASKYRIGCISLSHSIDRIDYACGEPNEMGVSNYCIHQNDEAVVERVKKKFAEKNEQMHRADEIIKDDARRIDALHAEIQAMREAIKESYAVTQYASPLLMGFSCTIAQTILAKLKPFLP